MNYNLFNGKDIIDKGKIINYTINENKATDRRLALKIVCYTKVIAILQDGRLLFCAIY